MGTSSHPGRGPAAVDGAPDAGSSFIGNQPDEMAILMTKYRSLDEGEILEGYLDGVHGYELGRRTRTQSYLHGWRTGMADLGILEPSAELDAIDRAFAHLRSVAT